FSVQYHPEAAAGPHDAAYLFDRFIELMEGSRDGRTANLSKEPVDSAHPVQASTGADPVTPNNSDNKTEDKK
ncbi:MAG: glutamine amidotransferase-related protein, partial [Actinomycetes bacterium]